MPMQALVHSLIVLILMCSELSESLWADGYQQITNVDFSPTCISVMEKRCADKQGMTCRATTLKSHFRVTLPSINFPNAAEGSICMRR